MRHLERMDCGLRAHASAVVNFNGHEVLIVTEVPFLIDPIQACLGYYDASKLRFFTPGPIHRISSRDGCYLAMPV
jgi:hypothetical protein